MVAVTVALRRASCARCARASRASHCALRCAVASRVQARRALATACQALSASLRRGGSSRARDAACACTTSPRGSSPDWACRDYVFPKQFFNPLVPGALHPRPMEIEHPRLKGFWPPFHPRRGRVLDRRRHVGRKPELREKRKQRPGYIEHQRKRQARRVWRGGNPHVRRRSCVGAAGESRLPM